MHTVRLGLSNSLLSVIMTAVWHRKVLRQGGIEPPAKPWKGFMLPLKTLEGFHVTTTPLARHKWNRISL